VTKLRNTPTGWDAFRAFRQTPAPELQLRHGNWKHGHYSKQSIAAARKLRLCIGTLRGRFAHVPIPRSVRSIAQGWSAYRAARFKRREQSRQAIATCGDPPHRGPDR
jgi:hypothetical protein